MSKRKPLNRGNNKEKSTRAGVPKRAATASRKTGDRRPHGRPQTRTSEPRNKESRNWIYGTHAVEAALKNPARTIHRLLVTRKAWESLDETVTPKVQPEIVTGEELSTLLPEGAVHQGHALFAAPLPEVSLSDILSDLDTRAAPPLLFLDQVSDPHNVGAILRSAAAFGAAAVVVQDRHAPQITGVLAKSASGALEHIPVIRVTNLARALEETADAGYFRLGLAGEAEAVLSKLEIPEKVALVLGAEGPGLRRLTREKCDQLVKLPTREPITSLNVSNAAAVALYAVQQR